MYSTNMCIFICVLCIYIYMYKLYIGLLFCEISPWLQHFEGYSCHGCHGLEMLDTDASCNAWGPQQIQRAWCPGTTNPLRPRSLCPERPRLSRLQRELLGGFNLPLWQMMEFVSWDYDISICFWKVIQNSMVPVTTNQGFLDDLVLSGCTSGAM